MAGSNWPCLSFLRLPMPMDLFLVRLPFSILAYENEGNPIHVGAVPEPGTASAVVLSTLAMGATGLRRPTQKTKRLHKQSHKIVLERLIKRSKSKAKARSIWIWAFFAFAD